MRRTWIPFIRGLVSLAITLALGIGVPVALVLLVGWPLPRSVPDLGGISSAMRTGINDEVVVNILAILVWIAWTQLAVALIAEVVSVARGTRLPSLPMAAGAQIVASRLVAGILLLSSPLQAGPVGAQPAPVPIVAEIPATYLIPDESLPPRTGVDAVPSAHPRTQEERTTVIVERHDSYWELAERHLGDGLRWREIQEVNVGRIMPDGHIIRHGDDALRAGWALLLPGEGVDIGQSENEGDYDGVATEEVTVASGDNLWNMSHGRLAADLDRAPTNGEIAPYWLDVMAENSDRLVEPGNPSLILPGQVLVMPPTGLAEPEAPPPTVSEPTPTDETEGAFEPGPVEVTPSTTAPTITTTPITTEARTPAVDEVMPEAEEVREESADGTAPWVLPLGGLSSVALAVGLKRLIDRRRRDYIQSHNGRRPPDPSDEDRNLHHAVITAADETRVDDLQLALGSLAAALADAEAECRPRVIRHASTSFEVLLDRPTLPAPPGWEADDEGAVWTLVTPPDPDEPPDGPMCPAPLVVTIGQPEPDAQLYLDLEADGVVSLAGDIEVARGLARSMLTELALTPLAESLRIIVIGDLVEPDAAYLDHVTLVETWYDIAKDITTWVEGSRKALIERGWANCFVGRGHDPDSDAMTPMAIIASKQPPPELLAFLVEQRPSAVAIVIADQFEGALATIRCASEALTLDDVELSFTPQVVDATELEDMGRFLSYGEDTGGEQTIDLREGLDLDEDDGAIVEEEPAEVRVEEHQAAFMREPPSYDVLVRLLGDIRVEGGSKELHAKATAVAAYLALYREVPSDRLEEACWYGSDGTSHRKRLLEAMTQCREALGSQHFPPNRDGTYRIGEGIRTDTELFDWHVARAAGQSAEDSLDSYRTALELVGGRPFSFPNAARSSFGWVDLEHHATTWEYRICTIAKAYAELCFDLDRESDAVEVLYRLLQAAPLNSDLVEALMRAHIRSSDRAAADSVYHEHRKALEQAKLGDPEDSIEQLRLEITLESQPTFHGS